MFTRDQHGTCRPVNSWLLNAELGTQVSHAANATAPTPRMTPSQVETWTAVWLRRHS